MFDTILINPMKSVIDLIFSGTGSYALSVILFTFFIRTVLLPLEIKQRKSTHRMSKLGPKIDAINKRYANDPEKKAQKTMELYKKEKVSPFSSCLPMLLQLPVIFAMIAVMNKVANDAIMTMFLNVQKGEQPMIQGLLWVTNLFQPDNPTAAILPNTQAVLSQLARASSKLITPDNLSNLEANYAGVMETYISQYANYANGIGILPILSGALQFLQTKLTPQQPGVEQSKNQKMFMTIMPLISVFVTWSFSAAFSLYWVSGSVYAIVQTLIITQYYKKKDAKEAEQGVQIT